MTINRTTLLDLPLPVTGTESGTWGDITNNGLTEYMDIAIAGMSNLTSANFTAGALTIETTEGNAAGTSISATSAQYAGFRVTSLAANSTITVGNTGTSPARSYRLINADSTYNLTFKATGQTGVTLLPGQSAVVAFNGTDYVIVGTVGAGTATDNAIARFDGTTGEILQNSAATIDDTGAATFVGSVNVSGTSASGADLKLYEDTDNGTNYVAFKSPASVASNVTWTLPSADGSNGQALTTNGSGTLAFSTISTAAATPTTLGTVYGSMTTAGGSPYLTALGYNAASINTGVNNTTVGFESLYNQTSGTNNTALGHQAMRGGGAGITGGSNVGIGQLSLGSITSGANNTAVGYQAGYGNTTANNSTAIGYQALYTDSTASQNTAVGYQAGYSTNYPYLVAVGYKAAYAYNPSTEDGGSVYVGHNAGVASTTGQDNTVVGGAALSLNNTGSRNTAVGSRAAYKTTSSYNVAIGAEAIYNNTSGANNVAVGYQTLISNTTASNNTAMGFQTLYANTTGGSNVAVGAGALGANSTGNYNVGIGNGALGFNSTASNNTAIGYTALYANTTGTDNTAVGYTAGDSITTGAHNACIGSYAGQSITTGNHNIAIGYDAGLNHTTGTQNIFLGRETRGSAVTASQQFVIGYNVAGQADDTITIGDSGGKIYNSYKVNATWTQTSDGRLKKNVQNDALGLSFINRLRPVTYEWKASNELEQNNPYYAEVNNRTTGVTMHGFIAQEVKAALDAEGCNTFNGWDQGIDGIQNISREMFISPLVKAVQELSAQVQALQAEIATLKGA